MCLQEIGNRVAPIASTAAPEEVSVAPVRVTSPEQLISAAIRSVRHIHLADHINLVDQALPWPGVDAHLGHPSSRTHTITVRFLLPL